jgi:hypothetical protein
VRETLAPSIREVAFNCPHCGAYTSQKWYHVYATERPRDLGAPGVVTQETLDRIDADINMSEESRKSIKAFFERSRTGRIFFDQMSEAVDQDTSGKYTPK